MQPRILLFDLETAPNVGYTWAKYQQDVIAFQEDSYILCFAYKWVGERSTHVIGQDDFPAAFAKDPTDDSQLVRVLHDLFTEADVLVGHNAAKFDVPKSHARMIVNGLTPPEPAKVVDTLKIPRSRFAFTSNSLGDLCRQLDLGVKQGPGFQCWLDCMAGDAKAWARMKRYCKADVTLLEKLYVLMRPWTTTGPNMAVLADRPMACPKCGIAGQIVARGWYTTTVSRRRNFRCGACGGYGVGRKLERTDVLYVN